MTAAKPDHVPCAICEEAAKVCDVEAEHIREDERRADSRIVNNPRAVERRGASVELPLVRAAAEIAVQRMVAERCAASIRASCTHATPPRSELADQLEALLRKLPSRDDLAAIAPVGPDGAPRWGFRSIEIVLTDEECLDLHSALTALRRTR